MKIKQFVDKEKEKKEIMADKKIPRIRDNLRTSQQQGAYTQLITVKH